MINTMSKNAYIAKDAHVFGNAKVFGTSVMKDSAVISGNVKLYDACQIYDTAHISGDMRVAGTAKIYGNTKLFGVGHIQGEADISSSNDWLTMVYAGKVITIYKSRCDTGFEVNLDGVNTNLVELSVLVSDKVARYLNQLVKERKWVTKKK